MRKKVPPSIAIVILSVVMAIVGCYGFKAYKISKQSDPKPPHALGKEYCIKCHSDAKTLAAMKDKMGD